MAALERKISAFSQRSLFSSASSHDEEIVPSEHRSSIVEGPFGRDLALRANFTKALMESRPNEFKAATETSFLQLAGLGKLPKKQLSRWLSQDRLYAESYICFITSLISRVTLPYAYVPDKSKSLRWRIVNLLTDALTNIHHELEFFTSTAEKYSLRLDEPLSDEKDEAHFVPAEATKQYIDLFRSFYNDATLPLIEGMVVLWATEQCYYSAWTYAQRFTKEVSQHPKNDADGGALREAFIPNWTSEGFGKFVDEIAELTDLLAEREQAGRKLEVYKAVWLHVLDIEKRFWPKVEAGIS